MKYMIELDCDDSSVMNEVIISIREFLDKFNKIQYAIEKKCD